MDDVTNETDVTPAPLPSGEVVLSRQQAQLLNVDRNGLANVIGDARAIKDGDVVKSMPFEHAIMADARRRGWKVGYLTAEDGEKQVPVIVDGLGRPIGKPHVPRASSGTVLPRGWVWTRHEKAGSRAALRRLQQLHGRGLHICASCDEVKAIVPPETRAAFEGPVTPGYHCLLPSPWVLVGGSTIVCAACYEVALDKVKADADEVIPEDAHERTPSEARPGQPDDSDDDVGDWQGGEAIRG